jgi:GDPmannose 4,6-dehydratase
MEAFIREKAPSHVFYLAAHHHSSQDKLGAEPELWRQSAEVQILGLVHVLEALRRHVPNARLFYASSSHVFGNPSETPQTERTALAPDNVYGITKVAGHHACRLYRERDGLFTSVGILYNHESMHRDDKFLSKKIVNGALAISRGQLQELVLGDLSASVDWGYAPDYVDAMVRLLALPEPDDYIIATGQPHTVRDFVRIAFDELGLESEKYVRENPALVRRSDRRLVGDAGKLRRETGWKPSVSFEEMVRLLTRQAVEANKTL